MKEGHIGIGGNGGDAQIGSPWGDLRILDLSKGRAGQYCSLLMAGFGADVIAVEDPAKECPAPDPDKPQAQEDPLSSFLMRGKKRICLDWKKRIGLNLLLQLAAKADVLVMCPASGESGDHAALFEMLAESNPAIILTSITPFGMAGPYRDFVSDGLIADALGGFLHGVGDPQREPLGGSGTQSELLAGACAYFATLTALFQRLADGQGQVVDISVQEVVASTLESALTFAAYSGWVWKRSGSRRRVAYHPVSNFPCADGFVHISILDDHDWGSLCEMLGCPGEGHDPRFASAKSRLENADAVDAMLVGQLRNWSRNDLYHAGQARRLPLAPVNSIADLLASPQLQARSFFHETFDLPSRSGAINLPFKLSGTPWTAPWKARHGESTHAVCGEILGLDEEYLEGLSERAVI